MTKTWFPTENYLLHGIMYLRLISFDSQLKKSSLPDASLERQGNWSGDMRGRLPRYAIGRFTACDGLLWSCLFFCFDRVLRWEKKTIQEVCQ